jgi:glycosyltransferase involved in cell wall biosynthesis
MPRQARSSVVHACGFSAEYQGNFIASLSRLRASCLRNGRGFAAVFPEAAGAREWYRRLAKDGWRVGILPERPLAVRVLGLARLLRDENATLIHTHFSEFDATAWLAVRLARLLGARPIRLIWHVHSDFQSATTPLRRLKTRIKFGWMGRSAHVLIVSEHLKTRLLASGLKERRLRVIPNGIDLGRLGVRTPRDPGARRENAVLMFGWHPFIKGVDVALEAFEIATRARGDLTLMVVGSDKTREAVRGRYPGADPPWLRLLPLAEDVSAYFQRASIFLSSSRSEGFPYAPCEALASGCLLVSSDIPALSWLKGSIPCWWFRSEDPADLAARILECASLRENERLAAAREGSGFIRRRLPLKAWAAEILRAYRRIEAS